MTKKQQRVDIVRLDVPFDRGFMQVNTEQTVTTSKTRNKIDLQNY